MKWIIITDLPNPDHNIVLRVADDNFNKALALAKQAVEDIKNDDEYDLDDPYLAWQLDSVITDEFGEHGIIYERHTEIPKGNVKELDEALYVYWIFFNQLDEDVLNGSLINKKEYSYMKKDAVEFLRGEANTLELYASGEDAFDRYVEDNDLDESEDYEEGGYDLSNYLENTWAHIADQVYHRRGYDEQFSNRIIDLIDAYYLGGFSYVENDVEAEVRLFAEALNYVADKLEGEIK